MSKTEQELADLHPDLRIKVRQLIKECPHNIGITSAWRSRAEQQRLYDGWKARKPGYNPANPPGKSKHEKTGPKGEPASEACDLSYPGPHREDAIAWAHANGHRFGLHFPIRKENWHVESNGETYRSMESLMAKLDDEDRKWIRAQLMEFYKLLVGTPGDKDIDPAHASINDVIRLQKEIINK